MADHNVDAQYWLCLLPNPPSEVSINSLKVAYGPGLTSALVKASKISYQTSSLIVNIAMAYDEGANFVYSRVQNLLGLMYRLICIICTEQRIDLQYDNDIDARLALFHAKEKAEGAQPIISLPKLAQIDRPWARIYSLEGENSEIILKTFLRCRNETVQPPISDFETERLPGGLSLHSQLTESLRGLDMPIHHHRYVAVGGTFDHLHAGHKLLLTVSVLILNPETTPGQCLTIGISGDELLGKKQYREELEDFDRRQGKVQNFIMDALQFISSAHVLEKSQRISTSKTRGREIHSTLKSGLTIKYVEIFDSCGPTITDESVTSLVLSAETREGGKFVNDKRRQKGWSPLEIFEVDVLDAGEDEANQVDTKFQSKISSTDIRRRISQKAGKLS